MGKRVGTLPCVRALELAGGLAAAAVLAAALLRRVLLRRRAVPAGLLPFARGISDALGDAVLVFDPRGRIRLANGAAARLAGDAADLVDRNVGDLAPDVAALARGLERGPASATVAVRGPAGPVPVRAAVVRLSGRPPLALAVLRTLPRPAPPPLPLQLPAPWADEGDGRAGFAAAADALRDPVAAAADALSIVRLAVPRLAPAAESALAAAQTALEVASRRVASLAAAGQAGAPRRVIEVAAVVDDVVASFAAPPGVRVVPQLARSRALADDRSLRAALREVLGAAAAALRGGGEIAVTVRQRGAMVVVEIQAPAGIAAGGLALARALIVPQGGRVDDEVGLENGVMVRIALEGAPALAPAESAHPSR